ncbi:hypothetical protein GFL96_35675 [Rhizobium leguminosarum bv. viciae]|nr:hypothetical protein [Rhizobium leguminosarum bv. viciae]
MQVSEKSITQMGYKRQESRPFLVFIARPLILRNLWTQNRAAPLLKLRLPDFTQSQTENRCTLFLELLPSFHAIPDGKPLRTFPGIAAFVSRNSGRKTAAHFSWNCFRQSRAGARPFAGRRRRVGRRPAPPW